MIGLPSQTSASALETVEFCEHLLQSCDSDGRLIPFTAPMAPFLDPGSLAFENPDRFGYHLHCRTLEDHRQALLAPTWKHILSYETEWMDRDTIAATTYETGRRLNQLKARYGIISQEMAVETEERIGRATALMAKIDGLIGTLSPEEVEREMLAIKDQIDRANTSTVMDKRELDVPVGLIPFNVLELAKLGLNSLYSQVTGR